MSGKSLTMKDLVNLMHKELTQDKVMGEEMTTVSKKFLGDFTNYVIGTIKYVLEDGKTVNLNGFAKFEVVDVPERDARNPQTGETIKVPAHKKVKVKVSKTIQDALKGK